MKHWIVWMLGSLLLGLLALPAAHAVERPAGTMITVTTTTDELEENGTCSLREAIQAANTDQPVDACPAGSGLDTIVLAAETYPVSLTGRLDDANQTGDFDIASPLIIQGSPTLTTTISGQELDRVLHVLTATASVTLTDITINLGQTDLFSPTQGGGLLIEANAQVTLLRTQFISNQSVSGGAISNLGTLMVTDSQFRLNRSSDGGALANAGTLDVLRSRFEDNLANGTGGGALANYGQAMVDTTILNHNTAWHTDQGTGGGALANYGQMTVIGSQITNNVRERTSGPGMVGGGVVNDTTGSLTLTTTLVDHNIATEGSGIYNRGVLTLNQSQLSRNSSSDMFDSLCAGTYGGGLANLGQATLNQTMVISNTSMQGGGIYNSGALTLNQSSLLENTVWRPAPCIDGAALRVVGTGSATLINTTVAENSLDINASALAVGNSGALTLLNTTVYSNSAGLANTSTQPATLTLSIVSGNAFAGTPADCTGSVVSGGANVLGDCAPALAADDVAALDPRLSARASNGLTAFYAPLPGSPALERAPQNAPFCPAVDQLDHPRPQDGDGDAVARCDAGAIEASAVTLPAPRWTIFVPLLAN